MTSPACLSSHFPPDTAAAGNSSHPPETRRVSLIRLDMHTSEVTLDNWVANYLTKEGALKWISSKYPSNIALNVGSEDE